MDQSNNIAAAFNAIWTTANLSSGGGSLVPGGLQWSKDKMKAVTARPYAQLWVKLDGKPQWTSGLNFLQHYLIQITAWCGSVNTVLQAVDLALENLINVSTKLELTGFLTESSQTVHITMQPDGLDQEDERDNQQNVGVVKRSWRVLLNQQRSNP